MLNDYRVNVGDLLKDEETGFETSVTHTRIMPYDELFQNAITYELSLSKIIYYR